MSPSFGKIDTVSSSNLSNNGTTGHGNRRRKSFAESQNSSTFAAGIADHNYSNPNSSDGEHDSMPLDKQEESKSTPSVISGSEAAESL